MRKRFWIYRITNNINGKFYIGQTCDISKRKSAHRKMSDKDSYIARSISKYGWKNHTIDILFYDENVSVDDANDIEIKYIKEYNSCAVNNKLGMNLNFGGTQGVQTAAQLKKMGISRFNSWKEKSGNAGKAIEVYTLKGDKILSHSGTHRDFAEKMGLQYNRKNWRKIQKHLSTGGMVCMKKYIIQWEGEDRVNLYRASMANKSNITSMRQLGKSPEKAIEACCVPVLDLRTGVFFNSLTEFGLHEGVDRKAVDYRLKRGYYIGKYAV